MRARDAYIAQPRDQKEPEAYNEYAESLRALPDDVSGIEGTIGKIRIYPGKALGELLVDEAVVSEYGLQTPEGLRDRAFMLGIKNKKDDAKSEYGRLSQREQPELALVRPTFDGQTLTYTAAGMDELKITLPELKARDGNPVTIDVTGDIVRAIAENGPITAHIRQFLRQFRSDVDDIDVLLPVLDHQRVVEDQHRCGQDGQTIFSDGGQELLASVSSLKFLNDRIQARKGQSARQVQMEAIRPNIEVHGWPANLEDILWQARIEGLREGVGQQVDVLFGNLCIRCSVTMVDTQAGQRFKDGEPLNTAGVARPKRLSGGKIPTFAVNTVFPKSEWGKTIRKGDKIIAASEKTV